MSNFLEFIDEDIEAKKTLLSTMPTKNKRDIKKYNEKITTFSEKYTEYKVSVKKYIDTKSKSFNVKTDDKNIDELTNNVANLEHVRFVLNPTNTYFEKMGFDNLLYQINNYYDFNFHSLNEILNEFLDKFETAEIKLFSVDFDYTCYVNEYMTAFLDARIKKSDNYDHVSEIFEKIYWINPEIIEHIELNFRKLVKKHEKKFVSYVSKLQKEIMLQNNITSYNDCLEKLEVAYKKLNDAEKEDIGDIISLAKSGAIDISNYFEDNRVRTSNYSSLMIDATNLDDKNIMNKFYANLEKLKINIEEYSSYIKFSPLIEDFKKEYASLIFVDPKSKDAGNKKLKDVESQIADKEAKLEKLNKKIIGGGFGLFETKNNNNSKQLKIDSVKYAKELYNLYKEYDKEYFKDKVLSILSNSLTISELLHLYYSFDYFKKIAIKRVFNVTDYDAIIEYSNNFDLFAMNPTNIVINEVAVFEENNIGKVIMNKYRLDNINLNDENMEVDSLEMLIEKIQFLLRINEIENSSTTLEKIWFMAQVERINRLDNAK